VTICNKNAYAVINIYALAAVSLCCAFWWRFPVLGQNSRRTFFHSGFGEAAPGQACARKLANTGPLVQFQRDPVHSAGKATHRAILIGTGNVRGKGGPGLAMLRWMRGELDLNAAWNDALQPQ